LIVGLGILPGLPHLLRGPVVEALVGPLVVALDEAADRGAGLVERLELGPPDQAFLELAEPRLDERLRLGVAVATAAVVDAETREHRLEAPRREGAAVVSAEGQLPGHDPLGRRGALHQLDRLRRPHRSSRCQPTTSRVQQSIAAIR
jgi:hypothetical protein